MMDMAFMVILDGPKKIDGVDHHYRIVVAHETGGYSELKDTGDESDPFYVAKAPNWFTTRAEARAVADNRNAHELHLTPEEASRIELRSIGARKASRAS